MLRFSANLSMLFGEYDFLARFEKAAQCGFRGVEFMFPYDYDIEEHGRYNSCREVRSSGLQSHGWGSSADG